MRSELFTHDSVDCVGRKLQQHKATKKKLQNLSKSIVTVLSEDDFIIVECREREAC